MDLSEEIKGRRGLRRLEPDRVPSEQNYSHSFELTVSLNATFSGSVS